MTTGPATPWTADSCIVLNKSNLSGFHRDLCFALNLFTLLERGGGPPSVGVYGGEFINYRIIAARDAAMNLYHCKGSIDAIVSLIPGSKKFNNADFERAMKVVQKTFKQHFPNLEYFRHGLAHAGDLHNAVPKVTTSQNRKDKSTGAIFMAAGGILRQALYEREFSIGRAGEFFTLMVNDETADKLAAIVKFTDAAFSAHYALTQPEL